MLQVYENTPEMARHVGWSLLPEHCFGDPSLPYVLHDPVIGKYFYSSMAEMSDTRVGVWDFYDQCFIEFIPCPGEERVRVDAINPLDVLGVHRVDYRDGKIWAPENGRYRQLDWRIDYT